MNEVSVKVEDFAKDESHCSELVDQGEVDPLALETDVKKELDPLDGEEHQEAEKNSCDDSATKEETSSESQNTSSLQVKEIKDELLKEEEKSPSSQEEPSLDSIHQTKSDCEESKNSVKPSQKDESAITGNESLLEKCTASSVTDIKEDSFVPNKENTKNKEVVVEVEMKNIINDNESKTVDSTKVELQSVNGNCAKEETTKRTANEEIETESPLKRLCQEVEKTFPQHDAMITDYIQTVTKNNIDEIQRHTEQLLSEIQTLRELAQKKEHEWNNILHLKKVKEEILLRLLRRKQVLSYEKSLENGSDKSDILDYHGQTKNLAIDKSDEISGLALKPPMSSISPMIQPQVMPVTTHFSPMAGLPPPYDKAAQMHSLSKTVFPQPLMMPGPGMSGFPREMNGQLSSSFGLNMGRQGPTKDVKSIIADYRQRNPDMNPRRGRRMKSILNPNMMNTTRQMAPKIDNFNNLGMMFNNLDMNQKAMLERLTQLQAGGLANGLAFKDVLVQFANMQQQQAGLHNVRPPAENVSSGRPEAHIRQENRNRKQERQAAHGEDAHAASKPSEGQSPRLPPPPYPEISLLPVGAAAHQDTPQQNSLLHGILTKGLGPQDLSPGVADLQQASPATQSFSPTLAKLLTSPERRQAAPLPSFGQAKNCGEITITPVQTQPELPQLHTQDKPGRDDVVHLDDEESPASEGSGSGSGEGEAGRLVIDESATGGAAASASAGAADGEAPLCQGCRRRDAQFVCAGCANQWYCSRDCQVAAWDEHSEMCSG